jgi:glutaminyl-peptide cyclotransferase
MNSRVIEVGGVLAVLLLSGGFGLFSCSPVNRQPHPVVDASRALELASEVVDMGPRPSGSRGALRNAEFIADHLRGLGLETFVGEWREITPAGELTFRNVIANIPGESGEFVLIGCHYDTKRLLSTPGFVGANDGASGVGLLLAMAEAVVGSGRKPPLTLKLAFFDGEECVESYSDHDGLHGSRHLAKELKDAGALSNCRAMVLLDMVGDKGLNITIPSGSDPKLAKTLLDVAGKQGKGSCFEMRSTDVLDDHTPFQKAGVPVIDVIDFEFGPSNRYWHTGEDTLDKISAESLGTVGNAVMGLVWRL